MAVGTSEQEREQEQEQEQVERVSSGGGPSMGPCSFYLFSCLLLTPST